MGAKAKGVGRVPCGPVGGSSDPPMWSDPLTRLGESQAAECVQAMFSCDIAHAVSRFAFNLEDGSALDRFHVLRLIAVAGAMGRDRLRSAPGGVDAIRPSRLRVVATRLLLVRLLPVGYQFGR
jgi:hypothetical protein